jgi:hypothetical protein
VADEITGPFDGEKANLGFPDEAAWNHKAVRQRLSPSRFSWWSSWSLGVNMKTVFRGLFREDFQHPLRGAEPRLHIFDALAVESTHQALLESVFVFQELVFIELMIRVQLRAVCYWKWLTVQTPKDQILSIDVLQDAGLALFLDQFLWVDRDKSSNMQSGTPFGPVGKVVEQRDDMTPARVGIDLELEL